MKTTSSFDLRHTLIQAATAGFVSLSASAIGMVELFGQRYILAQVLTLGQILIFLFPAMFAYIEAGREAHGSHRRGYLKALIIGAVSSLFLILLVWVPQVADVRSIFFNISPKLISLLTFDQSLVVGSLILFIASVLVSLAAAILRLIPDEYSNPLLYGLVVTLLVGMFSEILIERLRNFFGNDAVKVVFSSKALQLVPAAIIFVATTGFFYLRQYLQKSERSQRFSNAMSKGKGVRYLSLAGLSALLLVLPLILGTYLTEVANNVGLYILMGLGLNIVVGLAGLLDLGYVAFFAIGAYTMAVLTSTGPLGIGHMSFWAALPICVIMAAAAGIILGLPVLRMRGDYLAIVTLGFGEIIRILALSDLLKPYIGGAQGVLQIPKPSFAGISLVQPEKLYYVVLAGALLAAFISTRLRDSRLGRRWMAMREDEDVAEAMGINLVNTKLLAFAIGASFSGLSGAIFAAKLTSIFPHSFNLLISINVLSLIIVGGLGGIPGTIVGAAILVGLPELLREFQEFRYLMYGLLLIVMMIARPEGFIPSETMKRELHSEEEAGNQNPEHASAAGA